MQRLFIFRDSHIHLSHTDAIRNQEELPEVSDVRQQSLSSRRAEAKEAPQSFTEVIFQIPSINIMRKRQSASRKTIKGCLHHHYYHRCHHCHHYHHYPRFHRVCRAGSVATTTSSKGSVQLVTVPANTRNRTTILAILCMLLHLENYILLR